MTNPRFDLVDIIRIIERRRRFVITVTLICLALGVLFYLVRQKKYEATVAFFVSNPILTDRSNIFAGADSRYTDYFGDEDDIDRVIALAESDTVVIQTIKNSGLDKAYDIDLNDPNERSKIKSRFSKNLEVKRTEYKLLEVYYTDKDPKIAADVANEAVKNIGAGYSNFYNSRKNIVYASLKKSLKAVDSSIVSLTDTLARLREESGIYDLISPNRVNLVNNSVRGNGKDMGRYMEVIQNFESVKDMMVIVRSKYLSLLNQYSTGLGKDEMPLLHVITPARPPVNPSGPGLSIVLAASFFLGLFFSILYLLLTSYYKMVVSVNR